MGKISRRLSGERGNSVGILECVATTTSCAVFASIAAVMVGLVAIVFIFCVVRY
jgi:hypothetical protein